MSWRERSVIDERDELVRLAAQPGANMSELCRRAGVSRKTGYKWLERGRAGEGLEDRSRRPRSSPSRTADAVEAEVLRLRKDSNGAWGGRTIAHVLRADGVAPIPSPSTITEILRRHGKLEGSAQEHPGPYQRFERETPNELWQMDFKGHFETMKGRCHPLTVLDDHSRFALAVQACGNEQATTVRERLTRVFRDYGLPLAILADNGGPWGTRGQGRHTILTVWLNRLGIRVAHGRPYHPQTQGKDERFHRTIKAEVLNGHSFADLIACQSAFDQFRRRYNHRRPHQAIGMTTPDTRYRISPRRFPEQLPPVEYDDDDIVRKVGSDGYLSFQGKEWRIGNPFKGQSVALRPGSEDGLFTIHFCIQQIGTINMRKSSSGFVENHDALIASIPAPQPGLSQ